MRHGRGRRLVAQRFQIGEQIEQVVFRYDAIEGRHHRLESGGDFALRLAELDPGNAGWQRDLAVALVKLARLESSIRRHAEALPLYEEAARIFSGLVEKSPGYAAWLRERDMVERELAVCRQHVYASSRVTPDKRPTSLNDTSGA